MSNNYFEYYRRTIESHQTGLKLVGGGTGLGKTSSIPNAVMKAIPANRKGIYVANRTQLLHEMADTTDPNFAIILPRDLDVVRTVISSNHRSAFDELLRNSIFQAYTDKLDLNKVYRAIKTLDEIFGPTDSSMLPSWQEQVAEEYSRQILKAFRTVILTAKNRSKSDYNKLLDHDIVHKLFPFIAFKRKMTVRLLLVTLHKLFYGFFDGEKTITANHLKGYVIFADEFDFLENDLIQLIAQSRQIEDVFRFVEYFYREMQRHKMRLENYPVSGSPDITRRIRKIMNEIDLLHAENINYPDINQFISTEAPNDIAIFRTSHTVSSSPVYLCQTERAFNIVSDPTICSDKVFSARRLFTAVSAISEQILTLLKEIEVEDPATHQGIINDAYRNTVFPSQIQQVSQFPRRRPPQSTRLGALLDAGYSMYDIHYIAKATDPEEVELRNYAIYTTPEKFISTLAEKNLVFALSATADIHRCVNNFNLHWLGAKDGINLLLPDERDAQDVSALNNEKAAIRGNQLEVIRLKELDNRQSLDKQIRRFIATAFQTEQFTNDTKGGHLKRRVERFFSSLLIACERSILSEEIQSHLFFLNTYRDIEQLFKNEMLHIAPFYKIRPLLERKLFTAYELDINNQTFVVVFYNAEQAKRIRQTAGAKNEFNQLFHTELPVVVVTQYLTAGNGVNIQYELQDGTERDFLNLYLLEVPYFYFSNGSEDDTDEERIAKLKENLWYLAKLHSEKYLSEQEFRAKLSTLHKPNDWNNTYQHHPRMSHDYLLNTIASLIQAMGRIERVWKPIPDQSVVLCREAYHAFQQFLGPEFDDLRYIREPMISHNLQTLLAKIEEQIPQQERMARRKQDARLAELNEVCKRNITQFIERFDTIRSQADKGKLRQIWRRLRIAALRHDFADNTLQEWSAVYNSPNVHNGEVYLSPDYESLPINHDQPDSRAWRLNAVYDVVSDNHTIREYFAKHGYEFDFDMDGQNCFVPYFHQAILSGAIGEEAITALLNAKGIPIEDLSDELFEIADIKVVNKPWYIDCKNYSDSTMERFLLGPDDAGFYHKFTGHYFTKRAIEKWRLIVEYENQPSRLLFINTATLQERPLQYYRCTTSELVPVTHYRDADIVILQGALVSDHANQYHPSFDRLLNDMENEL